MEYIAAKGFHSTQTSRTGRAILPLFSEQFGGSTHSTLATENVAVTVSIPPLSASASDTLAATQGLQDINAVQLASCDIGQALITNVSVAPPAGILPGHPTIQIVSAQGTTQSGTFQPGQAYTKLSLQVGLTVFAMTAFAGGDATITASVILIGTATGNQ